MPEDRMPAPQAEFAPTYTAPGMIIRASYNLGGDNRVLQFERSVDADEPLSEINRICDVMTQAGDRLRAKFELPGLRRQFENVEFKHKDNLNRQKDMQAKLDDFKNERLQKAQTLDAEHKRLYETGYAEHSRSGRMGAFVPAGALKGNLARIKTAIAQLAAPIEGEEQDIIRNLAECENEIAQGNRAIEQLTKLIDEAERLARGEDISGV